MDSAKSINNSTPLDSTQLYRLMEQFFRSMAGTCDPKEHQRAAQRYLTQLKDKK